MSPPLPSPLLFPPLHIAVWCGVVCSVKCKVGRSDWPVMKLSYSRCAGLDWPAVQWGDWVATVCWAQEQTSSVSPVSSLHWALSVSLSPLHSYRRSSPATWSGGEEQYFTELIISTFPDHEQWQCRDNVRRDQQEKEIWTGEIKENGRCDGNWKWFPSLVRYW